MKNILTFIFLLLTLTGCEKHEAESENSSSKTIGLSVAVGNSKSTRAEATLLRTASEVGSIGLYVYVTRPNGIVEVLGENLKLNYVEDDAVWEYDDVSSAPAWGYTDGSDRYTFYAYAPYRPDGSGVDFDADNGEFSVDYSMSDNQDLMIAKTSDIVCPAGGVVTLKLKHTLSAISLNTTYSSVITKVELVVSDNYYASMPINGKARINENGVVEWSELGYPTTAERHEMSNESRSYILLLPQTISNKGDLFFSITSSKNDKETVDENGKIPAIILASNGIYKFNYKEPYFDVDENGDLVIHIDKIKKEDWNDFSAIDELIEKIKEAGHKTVFVSGTPNDKSDAYHMINHILHNSGMENYDLTNYNIPEGTSLPYNLFQNNTTIKSIVLPKLEDGELLDNGFWGCTSLETVVFPEGQQLTSIPSATFKGCTALKSVKLDVTSNTLKTINQDAFNGCVSLEGIELPSSVEEIEYGAFSGCAALSKINIPASVTDIGGQVFLNCTSLYSYGENKGIVFDERTAQDTPIIIGWHGFFNTHVRFNDIPDGYVDITTSNNGYFSEP